MRVHQREQTNFVVNLLEKNIKKRIVKKAAVTALTFILLSIAFVPSIHSQLGTTFNQILEKNTIILKSYTSQKKDVIPPVFDGRLETVYFTHGQRIYYGNILYQNASANLYFIDNETIDASYVWIAWVLNPSFVDNTYGNGTVPQYRNQIGNPCGHKFSDLNDSDKQEIKLYTANELVFHASMDLIHDVENTSSGYGIPTWGDGESQVYYGDPALVEYTTSTCFNINYYYDVPPYDVLVDSPTLGDHNYTLYPGYEDWEHNIIYELKVDRTLFGGTPINVSATELLNIHASPNRIGPHTIPLSPIYGSLGDYIWEDVNKDGIQDDDEQGISDVTVKLYYFYEDSSTTLIDTTTTNSSGYYLFNDLAPGEYYIKFILPVGYVFTLPDQTDDTYDSDADVVTGETITISLAPGEHDYTWDAGMYLEEYILIISIDGQGAVEASPEPPYTYGTVVTLTAVPELGWSFGHWSGDASGFDPVTSVMMDGDKAVIATFTQDVYTLTIDCDPVAGGSVSVDLAPPYYYGDVVELTAVENAGYSFSHWSGDASGFDPVTTVLMDDDKSVIAHFSQDMYTLVVHVVGSGSVTVDPEGPYVYGTVVTLTAVPELGWSFGHWSGDASGFDPVTSVMMDGDKAVIATFTQDVYTLTIDCDPVAGGSVSVDLAPPYYYGDVVELTALENAGYSFSHWSGDLSGHKNPETINMTGNKTVTAHFTSSIDTTPPFVQIVKPRNALYIFNKEILPINKMPIIFYMITIEATATDNESGIDRVEFYINGRLRGTATSEPYSYDWRTFISGKHTIQVKAYDKAGNSAITPELVVFKWRLHPILIFPLLTLAVLWTNRPFVTTDTMENEDVQ